MDKTRTERTQLQTQIDSMETELRQVQEEISEVSKQHEQVSGKWRSTLQQKIDRYVLVGELNQDYLAQRELV